ncbi:MULTISPECIES: YafY family protein [unclassified Rhodococcus (in: high G+C Gram-positive bacteria)]|uniref:helix-turn-helix transcriptional regulator n=1 Tax=unclassified Rhodococcus (in: high G+C Gram-positive bacteria) TaxID=192944 RepID=UPI001639959E|nr:MULTISPECIES: YafY family protein [unclassified Rhodococcus (in: high G+C Gram-positive bacteria)]MBC2638304.1 YafY family transcriptional regulator [Rhodococcus sp. 3A]MBC2896955.1 YafY family transcriptional regulator [Rhodococcus sp. 4CII]
MPTSKIERLMNLVICLLSTRQFLTAEKIRESVAGYADSASDEAFSRMFERDKNELRDLGVPLETGQASRFSTVEGYRINRNAYELPDIDLSQEESAAVAVAVQLWESPELTSAAQGALLKLRAAGVQVDPDSAATPITAVPARTRGSEPALGKLLAAVDAGRAVHFPHRGALNEPYIERTVEPWGVVTAHGRWYLVGHDVDRGAVRTFRLSRIGDDVREFGPSGAVHKPAGVDLREIVDRVTGSGEVTGTATVWVAEGRAQELRRLGTATGVKQVNERSGTVLEIPVRSRDWIARLVAGHGADALVLDPPELRHDVLTKLKDAAGDGGTS